MKALFAVGIGLLLSVALMIIFAGPFFEMNAHDPWLGKTVFEGSKAALDASGFTVLPAIIYALACIGLGLLGGLLVTFTAEAVILAFFSMIIAASLAASSAARVAFRLGESVFYLARAWRLKQSGSAQGF
jgi:hypothetical protein